MRRLIIIAMFLTVFAVVCEGRQKSRGAQLKIIQLPEPSLMGQLSLEQALSQRRSVRRFTSQGLDFVQIGQLAWAGQGITDEYKGFRTAPSAGAIYPIELYFVTADGMFAYDPDKHILKEIFDRDVRGGLAAAASGQESVAQAGCDIVITGSQRKVAAKYGNKAERFILLEAGHIAQNIQLQAVSLGLGAVTIGAFDIRGVAKVCELSAELEPLYIICVGYPAGRGTTEKTEEKKQEGQIDSAAKKAVLIVASGNFQDEELFETKRELEKVNVKTVIASTKTGVLKGMLGGKAEATVLVSELDIDDYDAVVFIGGLGAREYFESRLALNIAREAVEKKKILAAICIAPTVLANADVLKGVRATSFSSERVKLIKAGAQYSGAAVERDGLIITAVGPTAATHFGKTIAEALAEK